MRSFTELQELAWKRLWADHWFGRLFGGGLLLSLCGYAVNVVLGSALTGLNVRTWSDYCMAVIQNRQDLTTPVPNLTHDFIYQATSSGAFSMFIGYIMAGIAAYGSAVILLRCLRNEEHGWLGAAFGGFRDPFGMLWLMIRYILVYVVWGLFLLIPPLGIWLLIIAFYRYRFLFLVKAEHPDWSAGACMKRCRELMRGHKMDSFRLDCAYWKPITLVMLLALAAMVVGASAALFKDSGPIAAMLGLAAFLALIVSVGFSIVLGQYISVGQGFLYLDLKNAQATSERAD